MFKKFRLTKGDYDRVVEGIKKGNLSWSNAIDRELKEVDRLGYDNYPWDKR